MRTVLAVDGGNSKTDVAIVGDDGRLLAAVRGPTTSHQAVGLDVGMDRLAGLVEDVSRRARPHMDRRPDIGVYCLAGVDTVRDSRRLDHALTERGLAVRHLLRNDTAAALRAGTDRGWGVVVICGQGVNAAGIAPDGRTARLAALGAVSGDWGGGTDVGWQGLAGAVRARDRRGPRTRLERSVPAYFELASPRAVTSAMYEGRIAERRIGELAPVVFAAADAGDEVARAVVDRLADEIVAMAGAMIRQLRLRRTDPDVVLAGGVFRTTDRAFYARIEAGVHAIAPQAQVKRSAVPPVAGAALLGLDDVGATESGIRTTARDALRDWDAGVGHRRATDILDRA